MFLSQSSQCASQCLLYGRGTESWLCVCVSFADFVFRQGLFQETE